MSTGEADVSGDELLASVRRLSQVRERLDASERRGYPRNLALWLLRGRSGSEITASRREMEDLAQRLTEAGSPARVVAEAGSPRRFAIEPVQSGDGQAFTRRFGSPFFERGEYRRLVALYEQIRQFDTRPIRVFVNGAGPGTDGRSKAPGSNLECELDSAGALLDHLLDSARRHLKIQRYKGLGEMDAEELWDTTMDPDVRSLKRVQVEDDLDAAELFSTLMGDQVEPRRAFIEKNALNVSNLDV